jgi:PAS domain S-box-containing protein
MLTSRSTPLRYTVAIGTTLLALLLCASLRPWGQNSPYWFFAPAVMISAWYGGRGPGILATVAGALLGNYFLLEPYQTISLRAQDISRVTLFLLVGLQISWLSGEMYNARRRAESDALAARRSEKLYRTLASNFPEGFVGLFDRDLRWTLVAGAGLAAAGLSREHMEGRPILESLPPGFAPRMEALCRHVLTSPAKFEELAHTDRVYFCHALPLKSSEDAAHAGMVIVEDITERAKARDALQWAHDNLERRVRERTAELHFQKTLLEAQNHASADGILAASADGRVLFANRRLWDMWRLPADGELATLDAVRRFMREQLEPLQQDPLAADKTLLPADQAEGLDELMLLDGRTFERYSAPMADPAGRTYGRVWFFRDITERRRLQREILEIGERERLRIGQDLHDDLCQQLAGIACMGRVLQQRLLAHADHAEDAHDAREIVHMVQRANQRARDLARGLQPVGLEGRGLIAAMVELCKTIGGSFKVACTFHEKDAAGAVDEATGIQLYRIAQEAISNAIRHGRASRLDIALMAAGDRLILTVEDDGVGIPEPLPRHGMGLSTMNYRAKLVGGSLTVAPGDVGGTIVTCSVPLKEPPKTELPVASTVLSEGADT